MIKALGPPVFKTWDRGDFPTPPFVWHAACVGSRRPSALVILTALIALPLTIAVGQMLGHIRPAGILQCKAGDGDKPSAERIR